MEQQGCPDVGGYRLSSYNMITRRNIKVCQLHVYYSIFQGNHGNCVGQVETYNLAGIHQVSIPQTQQLSQQKVQHSEYTHLQVMSLWYSSLICIHQPKDPTIIQETNPLTLPRVHCTRHPTTEMTSQTRKWLCNWRRCTRCRCLLAWSVHGRAHGPWWGIISFGGISMGQ